ncbi:hypothetical protein POM88_029422 [Heracleum sosnowskyi]|uniref:Transposase n=1 Tax=Heracleum sosnowskyi TaxID=360622 RepID=A0AAD8HUW7_9APIA|nr:hypothetical protein POM88_029422 [Heracleum sosnowskyi]
MQIDADVTGLVDRLTDGSSLDLYIDTVIDKAIEPANQIQPHVIIRPRTQYFEGPNFQLKQKFVTIQDLKQQQLDKKKSATGDGDKQIMRTIIIKKPSENEKKSGSELKKINTNDEEILVPTEKEKVVKVADFELKRKKRMEENQKEIERLKLEHKAAELAKGKSKTKAKNVVVAEWSSDMELEFDRPYVSGHDSLSEEEIMHVIRKKRKKVVKVKDVTSRPRTRAATNVEASTNVAGTEATEEELPPPPPLPVDRTTILRVPANEGIGSMEAYLLLQQQKRDKEEREKRGHDIMNYEGDCDSNHAPPVSSVFETGESSTKIRRCRGPTKMNHVFTRKLHERPVIRLNRELQPVSKKDKVVAELSSFCGTIARLYIPLDFVNWSKVPKEEKDGWWEYIKTEYIIPEEGKYWVLKTLDDNWRVYKSHIKARCFTKYDNDEDRLKSKPPTIPLQQFKVLLKYWSDESVQEKAAKCQASRKNVTDTHKAGRTSFAQLRSQMKTGKLGAANPTMSQFYPKTRKIQKKKAKKDGENAEESDDEDEEMVELDLAGHGPNWLVGRSGRTRRTKKNMPKKDHTDSAELAKVREEIVVEMQEKMKKKLRKIFEKLAEMNPTLNVNVEELCAESSDDEVDADDDEDDEDEENGEDQVDSDDDEAAADGDEATT